MLSYMRKHSKTWFTRLVFGMIIAVFVLWGGSTYMAREANMLAKVDGRIITIEQFERNYEKAFASLQERFGGVLTPEMVKTLNLRQNVLDDMINMEVLEQEAERMDVRVTDEELRQAIQSEPAFKTAGQFDVQRYNQILNNAGLTPVDFEDRQRSQMLMDRLAGVVTAGVVVTAPELEAYYRANNDVFELNYLKLSPEQFVAKVSLKPGELETYFDANRERYKVLPKTAIEYVEIKTSAIAAGLNIADGEARAYYDAKIERYTTKASARVSQILVRIPEGADAAVLKAKQAEAERLYKLAASGDFAAVAKQSSEDPSSAPKGGDLGLIGKTSLPDGLGSVVFAMQPGQVKGPVRSSQAFHIFKLASKQDEVVKPFETVKAEVVSSLKLEKAREMSRTQAEESFNKLYEQASPDLKTLVQTAGLTLQTAGPYLASERPAVPAPEKLVPASFTFQPGQLGDLLETSDGYVIYKVVSRVPARLPELKEVKSQVEQDIRRVKATTLARQEAERLAKLPLASLNGLSPQTTGGFKRSSWSVPTLTGFDKIKDELDQLATPHIYDKAGELAVVWLKSKQVADYAKLAVADRQNLSQSLLNQKRQEAFKAFVQSARASYEVVINKDRI